MNHQSVNSSNIDSVGYLPDSRTLEIRFHNGRLYQYFDVPDNVHQELVDADSVGRFFNSNIRGVYRYARI